MKKVRSASRPVNLTLRYFATYMLVVLFATIFSGLVLSHYHTEEFSRIRREQFLSSVEDAAETAIENVSAIENAAQTIRLLDSFSERRIQQDPLLGNRLVQSLSSIQATNPLIHTASVLFSKLDKVYTAGGLTTPELFTANRLQNALSAEQLRTYAAKFQADFYIPDDTSELVYLLSASEASAIMPRGLIIVQPRTETLFSSLLDLVTQYEGFFILRDEKSGAILEMNHTGQPIDALDTAQYICMELPISNTLSLQLGFFDPILQNTVRTLYNRTLLFQAVVMAICTLLAYLLARRLYRPVARASEKMGLSNPGLFWDEMDKSIARMVSAERYSYELSLEARHSLFEALLYKDDVEKSQIPQILSDTLTAFTFPHFYAVLLVKANQPFDSSQREFFESFHTVDAHTQFVHLSWHYGYAAIIVNTDHEDISLCVQTLETFLSSPLIARNMEVSAYLGTLCKDIFGIGSSYQNAMYTFSTARGLEGRAFAFELLDGIENTGYLYPQQEENALRDAVIQNSAEKVDSGCRALNENLQKQGVSPRTEWGIRISILGSLKNALDKLNRDASDFNEGMRAYLHLNLADISLIRDSFITIVQSALGSSGEQAAAVNESIRNTVEQMKRYIDENYGSYEISQSAVAEHVSLSASYATKLFRDVMGCSIKAYIDTKRMDAARHMLEHTDYPAEKIAYGLGYTNVSTFYTKFKKTYGITTQQYRAMHQK